MNDTEINTDKPPTGPLEGLTVLDLTRVLSGPYCTMMLADMGARVIKVEQPGKGDDTRGWGPPFQNGESAYFLSVNRNKESVTLNFKHPDGREVLDKLMERADVLVENFRPGTLERQGLGYNALSVAHPGLVYCSISGFGQTGPRRSEPGYDAVMQGEGGLMSITGPPGGTPYRLGVAIADIVSGMFAAFGVAMGLLARERTGHGQFIDVGMLDSVAALLTYQAGIYFATGQAPPSLGTPPLSPTRRSRRLTGTSSWRRVTTYCSPNFARSSRHRPWPPMSDSPPTRDGSKTKTRFARCWPNGFAPVPARSGWRFLNRRACHAAQSVT